MTLRRPKPRELSISAAVGLAVLILLGSTSPPPDIAIGDLSKVGTGEIVCVRGSVVDEWASDSGSVSLILADLVGGATLKVVCCQGTVQKTVDVHVGDMVSAIGELELTGGRPVLWCNSEDVQLVQPSRDALTLDLLAGGWDLLVGDRFEVAGVVVSADGGQFRLADLDGAPSIALESLGFESTTRFLGRRVILDATLRLEEQTMTLVLEVHTICLGP